MGRRMTVKELSQLFWLTKEIEYDIARLRELESVAYYSTPRIDGMPHQNILTNDMTANCAIELAEIESRIKTKIKQRKRERLKLEKYINSIPDSLTRQIFTLRFVEGKRWEDVSEKIGGGNTADSVKKTCYRYLKNSK